MTGEMNSRFSIVLRSDIDYEHLFASIEYDGVEIAVVSQEDGRQSMKLEASVRDPAKRGIAWVVDLDGFLDAVKTAQRRLMER